MGGFLYLPYYYQTYIVAPYHNFPEPVAKKLRRAIFYSSGRNMDVREANKYFRQGLQIADEMGMDSFSDEIIGVKISIAAMFERAQHYKVAIDVLEIIRRDCFRWVEELGDKHWNDGKRTRVLAKTVALNVKLGELYGNQYVANRDAAEERLVEAVETVLKEKQRREQDGVQPGEGDWLSDEEAGASLECMLSFISFYTPPLHRISSFDQGHGVQQLTILQLLDITTKKRIYTTSRHHYSYKRSLCAHQSLVTPLY